MDVHSRTVSDQFVSMTIPRNENDSHSQHGLELSVRLANGVFPIFRISSYRFPRPTITTTITASPTLLATSKRRGDVVIGFLCVHTARACRKNSRSNFTRYLLKFPTSYSVPFTRYSVGAGIIAIIIIVIIINQPGVFLSRPVPRGKRACTGKVLY